MGIALLGREWQYRVYYHHTGYPAAFKHMGRTNGKLWIPAWQLHERDPTLILWKAVYNNMENTMMRKNMIARFLILDKFPNLWQITQKKRKIIFLTSSSTPKTL